MTTYPTDKVLRSGRIAFVDDKGRAELATCTWLVEVPTASLHHPDSEWYPDSPADVYTAVDCGAPLFAINGDLEAGWYCSNGHRHLAYGSAAQQAEERLEGFVEYTASIDPNIAARLDAGDTWQDVIAR